MEPTPADLLTVDELAHRAGTTTRTVRAYQTKGLLPAPRKIGRIAYYGPEHLARLQLIERLLSRGFLLSAIGDLLRAFEQGSGLEGLLGHPALQERTPGRPASPEVPASVEPPAGAPATVPGVPALEQAEALRDQLASISDRFVDLLRREAWKAAVDEIRAADRRESGLDDPSPTGSTFPGSASPGGAARTSSGARPAGPESEPVQPGSAQTSGGTGAGPSDQALDEADELQRELAAVSDRFVDLLRREAWRAVVTEIRESSDGT